MINTPPINPETKEEVSIKDNIILYKNVEEIKEILGEIIQKGDIKESEGDISLQKINQNLNNNMKEENNQKFNDKSEDKAINDKIKDNNKNQKVSEEMKESNNEKEKEEKEKGKNSNLKIEINIDLKIVIGILVLVIAYGVVKLVKYYSFDSKGKKIEIKLERRKPDIETKKPIIGIDFGSSFSGYAFWDNNIMYAVPNNKQVPTVIILNKTTLEGIEFGEKAKNTFQNKMSDDNIYFDRIKLKLDPEVIDKEKKEILIEAKYPKNYKIPLKKVISEFLRLFSNHILEKFKIRKTEYKNLKKDDIKWIVTVPAIWNEYGKQFMIKCAKNSGLNDIGIALEPEAASLTFFNDYPEYLKKKKKFLCL